jgi:hypothetical protein
MLVSALIQSLTLTGENYANRRLTPGDAHGFNRARRWRRGGLKCKGGPNGPPIQSTAENECLLSGDGVLEKVRILEARELDRKSAVQVAHHPAGRLADAHHRSDRRPKVADHPDA